MFFEKWVVDQFFYAAPVVWILLQAAVQKVSDLCADEEIGRDFDLVLDDFNEFLFAGNFEGVFPHDHLVHHDADRPDIYLLIILASFEDFGADVEGRAAKGGP
jgi:hypothetical protein